MIISQVKLDEFVLYAKAHCVNLCCELISMGTYGSYKFEALKNKVMYLMSYIKILEDYPMDSEILSDKSLITIMEKIDLLTLDE